MLVRRKAVAMIELIFAIVVMGIAMLAIPMITVQSAKGVESAMMQESISQVASNINIALGKYWDEVNTVAGNESEILITDSDNFATRAGLVQGDADNPNDNYNGRRTENQAGIPHASNSGAGTIDEDPDGNDDISDLDNQTIILSVYNNAQKNESYQGDYIDKSISMTSTVTFAPDSVTVVGNKLTYNFDPDSLNTPPGSSNIKRVNVLLSTTNTAQVSNNGQLNNIKQIQLNGFSCNIGAATPRSVGKS